MTENQNPEEVISSPPVKGKPKKKVAVVVIVIIIVLIVIGIFAKNKFFPENSTVADNHAYPQVEALFSAAVYDQIPQDYKVNLYNYMNDQGYLDGTYFMTKIPDRAKRVFAFGDYTDSGNGDSDLAVLLEKNDFKSSKLVIFNDKGEVLFMQDYDFELPVINSFKSGAKIFLTENKLIPSPVGGLIIQKETDKYVVLYDKKSKKFSSYYQYTDEDNLVEDEGYNEGGEYEEAQVEPEESTSTKEIQKPTTEVETPPTTVPEIKDEAPL